MHSLPKCCSKQLLVKIGRQGDALIDRGVDTCLLVPHVLISVLCLVEGEDLVVDDGLDVVCLDGAVHLFELQPAADEDATNGADVVLVRWLAR
jgi:hypothetical protein